MFKLLTNARTVKVFELKVEKRNAGTTNEFDAKSILFTVASNRPYAITKKNPDGSVVMLNGVPAKERQSDFFLCKATGNLAQTIADHCADTKPVVGGAPGAITTISRFLSLEGHLENYKSMKPVKMEKIVNIAGKDYKIEFDTKIEVDATIFIVHDIVDFLDSKPVTGVSSSKSVTETVKISEVPLASTTPDATVQLNNNAQVSPSTGTPVDDGEFIAVPPTEEECPF